MNLTEEQMRELYHSPTPNLLWVRLLIDEIRSLRREGTQRLTQSAELISLREWHDLVAAIFDDADDDDEENRCGTCGVPFGATCQACGSVLCTNTDCSAPGPRQLNNSGWTCCGECYDQEGP